MRVRAIKAKKVIEPGYSLEEVLGQYILKLTEKNIIAITSKIISVCQGCLVKKAEISKYELIKREADLILETEHNPYNLYLTIKNGMLIPSAGIDESNVNGVYVLYPNNIQQTAISIWQYLRKKYCIQNLGVIITDSHTTIMRRGVTGIAIGWCGFEPLYSYINKPDIYGKPLMVTKVNILDSLATMAVFAMGEGNEQTPFAIITGAPKISFLNRPPNSQEEQSIIMPMEEDLYGPLIRSAKWLKK